MRIEYIIFIMQKSLLYDNIIKFLKQQEGIIYFQSQFDFFSFNLADFGESWVNEDKKYKDIRLINIAPQQEILNLEQLNSWYYEIFPNQLIGNAVLIKEFEITQKQIENKQQQVLELGFIDFDEQFSRGEIDTKGNLIRINSYPLELRLIKLKFYPSVYFASQNNENGKYNSVIDLNLIENLKI